MAESELRDFRGATERLVTEAFKGHIDQTLADEVSDKMFREVVSHPMHAHMFLNDAGTQWVAEKKFEDGAKGRVSVDEDSAHPLAGSNWTGTLSLPDGTVLQTKQINNGKFGVTETIALPGPNKEEATYWHKPLCDLGPQYKGPHLSFPELYSVARVENGVRQTKVLEVGVIPSPLPPCPFQKGNHAPTDLR